MKKENTNSYYTEEDLSSFEKLNNFKKFKTNKLNNSQLIKNQIKYSISDNKNFDNIMNIKNNEKTLSKKVHKSEKNIYYNSSDFQKFNKLKQFMSINIAENSNIKNEYSKNPLNYTSDDVNKFDKIIKTKNENETVTNNKKIKIIDFNKLKEKERNFKNKLGIEKIKIVYFD